MNPRPAASGLGVNLPQHPDQDRPKHPVLLAVDREFGEFVGPISRGFNVP